MRRVTAPPYSITSSASAGQPVRNVETERLGGLEIDDHFEYGRLRDWQVGRLLAFEDAACIGAGLFPAGARGSVRN